MRRNPKLIALALVLAAAGCGRDAGQLTAPTEPRLTTFSRTYGVSAVTLTGSPPAQAGFSGGHVDAVLVADADGSFTFLGTVESNDGPDAFFKPANQALRLTAVPVGTGCVFDQWVLSTPTNVSITVAGNPINVDDYRPYSYARAEFVC